MKTLKEERALLAEAEYSAYDVDAFPGSAKWMENKAARDALKIFDTAHPEIIAGLEIERKAAQQARYDKLSDFVKNGS